MLHGRCPAPHTPVCRLAAAARLASGPAERRAEVRGLMSIGGAPGCEYQQRGSATKLLPSSSEPVAGNQSSYWRRSRLSVIWSAVASLPYLTLLSYRARAISKAVLLECRSRISTNSRTLQHRKMLSMTRWWLFSAARCSAVLPPSLMVILAKIGAAECCSKASTIRQWPRWAALWSAVKPHLSVVKISTSASSRDLISSKSPSSAA